MSALDKIQSVAEEAILELELEMSDMEDKIEAYKLQIQNSRIQIQALKKFLSPEENIPVTHEVALSDIVLKVIVEFEQQSVHYKDLTDIIAQNGYEFTGKQPDKTVLNCLTRLVKSGSVISVGKGYYEAARINRQEDEEALTENEQIN